MRCQNCGAEVQPDQKFCSNCGVRLQEIGAVPQGIQGGQNMPLPTQQQGPYQQPKQQLMPQSQAMGHASYSQAPFNQSEGTYSTQNTSNKSSKLKRNIIFCVIVALGAIVYLFQGEEAADNAASTQQRTSNAESVEAPADNEDTSVVPDDEDDSDEISIPESVIYDGNGVIIKVTGCEQRLLGTDINFHIENNSSVNLEIDAHSYGINGIMTRNNIYDMDTNVAAGKKANATLTIGNDVLDRYDIDTIRNIEINFWAYDTDESYKEFETGQLQFGTSADDGKYDVFTGTTLLDENGIRVDYLGRRDNEFMYAITNNTGAYFTFDLENLTVNDYTSSDVDYDLYDEELLDGCQYVFSPTIDVSQLENNNVNNVESIQFTLKHRTLGDYFKESSTSAIVNDDPQKTM